MGQMSSETDKYIAETHMLDYSAASIQRLI